MTNARPLVPRALARISRSASSLFSKIKEDPDFFLKYCSHIIHVGANTGQERELYHSYGLAVDWIEPIPAVYEQLVHYIQPYPKQVAIQALLTDHGGDTVKLNIASNSGASSSIFDLALHKDIWPEIDYVDHLQVRTETLDGLLERGVVRLPVDAIIIDTQGSELLVLKGAEAALRGISYLKVEAADFESYKGGTTTEAIEAFLKQRSFRLLSKTKFARHPSGGGYYDLLYKRSPEGRPGTADGGGSRGLLIKSVARQLLGEATVGMIEYYRYPERRMAWGGPFNGQRQRRQIFKAIVTHLHPTAFIETGTYLGTTTEYMAGTGIPIYTIEADRRNYGFSRARLRRKRNVMLRQGDSREELLALFDGPLGLASDEVLFAYLDAHWKADLPLIEELEIVFSRCPAAIVMIDDFQVPFDPGYGYDDYGPGKALSARYIAPVVSTYQLQTFYPSTPSVDESGLQRGCVVLAKKSVHGRALSSIPLLRLVEQRGSSRSNQAGRP